MKLGHLAGSWAAAAFVQQRMVLTVQQQKIRQACFATIGPVPDVMTVDVAAVRALHLAPSWLDPPVPPNRTDLRAAQ